LAFKKKAKNKNFSSQKLKSRVVFHGRSGAKRGFWLALAGVLELFFNFG
jgi:hypothetical protein